MVTARSAWTGERRADLRYSTGALSIWAGGVRTDGLVSDTTSPLRTRLESEFRLATTKAEIALSLSGGRRTSRAASVITLARGPLAFVNVGFSNAPTSEQLLALPRRSMSVGLRFSSATFASRAADRRVGDASSSTFIVQRETAGRYRMRVKIAGARVVELASDCTRWQPVVLARERENEWEIVLPVSAGSNLVNIRVDGGQWIAPPGLVAKTDDFAGVVGVFVVD